MKRRGGRVVSSKSTVVGASSAAVTPEAPGLSAAVNGHDASVAAAATAAAAAASLSPSLTSPTTPVARDEPRRSGNPVTSASATMMDVPTPTLTIPTLDIFARFQSKRDDFDEDWLLLQEDPAARNETPRIAAHVADKLRRHQAQLGAHRAAAAADRIRQDKDRVVPARAAAKTASSVSGDGLDTVATEGPRQARRQRCPETYDSAEDSGSDGAGADADIGTVAADNDGDDSDEYVPEDRTASQYKRPQNAKKAASKDEGSAGVALSGGSPPVSTPAGRTAAAGAGAEAASVNPFTPLSEDEEQLDVEAEHDGLTGDYLNFRLTSATGSRALDADALQATVHLQPSPSHGEKRNVNDRRSYRSQEQRRQTPLSPQQTEQDRVLVVPLWSIARMEQHGGYCSASPLIALHQEVTDLVDYLRPTEAEVTMRRYIEKDIGRLVDRLWPGSSVLVYGSMYTHLLLPLSDLDITLLDVPVPAEEALTSLAKEISSAGLCENVYPQVILKTKVPLIKFVHKGSLIDVDISVGAVDGKRNSECIVQYMNMYPEALPLTLVVKYFVMQRGMHEPYYGGLGSYAATLLVVAFLRQHPIYTTQPEKRTMTGLGRLLVDFFRMCGQHWNYRRVAVCLANYAVPSNIDDAMAANVHDEGDFRIRADCGGRMQSPVLASPPRGPMGPAQVWIEDPVDASNNAASSLRFFHSLSAMFSYAYLALTTDFDRAAADAAQPSSPAPSSSPSSPSSNDISRRPTLLSRIFHADAEMVYRRRAVAAAYKRLNAEMPAYMKEVQDFRRDEDAAMLQGNCDGVAHSWRARRLRRREGDPILFPQQRNVTSLEERLALSHLRESSSPPPPASEVDMKKRQREAGDEDSQRKVQRDRREDSALPSRSSSRSSPCTTGSESNASSVRVDVTRRTERSRKLRR
ncbi:topoisomerase-related function protein-like protein [Leishmania infantum JPCM5]|uniref:Topoisomerase-related_function_protein-like_protein n=2 Tax=Leishmania infantum TaxID=5671 RepID=A0A6L0WIH7_LEIIN|nr:topoisomerase-related function protein-like protein [Leishmania infantum JPCM5]CAC9448962.1 topoisomerase-related_function_protein-like_protein [Leishmania infantum]CAM65641.1 topoisomerase-related function protein-like protein [Leishmania infantum JPCM5]SUZ39259.1 topoisomerase-related_function_protein-like_protein [Leishmania infantum]|eukprot:XP_001463285.1 topoisomerase-related function protein-like protein [Leishmania infantum JPCM5]